MGGHRLLLLQAGTKCSCLCLAPCSGLRIHISREIDGITTTIKTCKVFQSKGNSTCLQYDLTGGLPLPGITGVSQRSFQ